MAPRYLIRDRDASYGPVFVQRLRAMGIRDRLRSDHPGKMRMLRDSLARESIWRGPSRYWKKRGNYAGIFGARSISL
jgi:hypothetical protein